jgi:hypothetical protein
MVRNEGIGTPFGTECRCRAVTRNEAHVVTHGPETIDNGAQKRCVIAAREVGAADRAPEEDVAHDGEPALCLKKHNVAGRVPRAVHDLQFNLSETDPVALRQPAIGQKGTRGRQAKLDTLPRQRIQQKTIIRVRTLDADPQSFAKIRNCAGVIDMPVRHQYPDDLHPGLVGGFQYPVDVTARVHDRCHVRRLTAKQGAILSEGGYGDDDHFHGSTDHTASVRRYAIAAPGVIVDDSVFALWCRIMRYRIGSTPEVPGDPVGGGLVTVAATLGFAIGIGFVIAGLKGHQSWLAVWGGMLSVASLTAIVASFLGYA